MTIQVGYAFVTSQIQVGYDFGAAGSQDPVIVGTPTVTDGSAITINGVGFSATGNSVFLNGISIPVDTEGTTQIVTEAFTDGHLVPRIALSDLYVTNDTDVESNSVQLQVQSAAGRAAYAITQEFLGDAESRLSADPDLLYGWEIEIGTVVGTNVTVANVNVSSQGAPDIVSDTDDDPNVTSFDYRVWDGAQWSATWVTVTWGAAVSTAVVPDVDNGNKTQAQAEADIAGVSLTSSVVATVSSNTVTAGNVIAQFPAAGTTVEITVVVELTISSGVGDPLVPNVIAQTKTDATTALNALDSIFEVTVEYEYVESVEAPDTVVAQSVAPGTLLEAPITVTLQVAGVEIPDVSTLTQAAGTSDLEADGFTVAVGAPLHIATIDLDDIVNSSPAAGTVAGLGSAVTIYLSLGAGGGGIYLGFTFQQDFGMRI